MLFKAFRSLFSNDLAIDIGTTNVVAYAKSRGIVVSEPSVVAFNRVTKKVEVVGKEALDARNKRPGLSVIRPLTDGVINDVDAAAALLQYIIRKAHRGRAWASPRVVVGLSSEVTDLERRALEDAVYQAGASEVYLIDKILAAAIGSGLPITEPQGNMIVDIGGGTTDIAVISLAGIVYSRAVRVAGNAMDEAITQYIRHKYDLVISERTAEAIKIQLGSGFPLDAPLSMDVRGRNIIEGVPKIITISDEEVREALADCVAMIANLVRVALDRTPPELSADIVDNGVVLTGGVALLQNLDRRVSIETGLPVSIAHSPMLSVVLGASMMLHDFDLLKRLNLEGRKTYLTKSDLKFNVAYYSLYLVLGSYLAASLLRRQFGFSNAESSSLGLFLIMLMAYPLFTGGMRMRRARRESDSRWTFSMWVLLSLVIGCMRYLLSYI
jgi:rod shape-determining protein MreB